MTTRQGETKPIAATMSSRRMPMTSDPPNPGSAEAKARGCKCAVLDNNHGKFPPMGDDWWITEGCPLHTFPEAPTDDQ
jgi:hypothetical protein